MLPLDAVVGLEVRDERIIDGLEMDTMPPRERMINGTAGTPSPRSVSASPVR